jgi:hypothetical protein
MRTQANGSDMRTSAGIFSGCGNTNPISSSFASILDMAIS